MPQTSAVLKGKRCMCPTCKEVFSSATGFDKHRKGTQGHILGYPSRIARVLHPDET